MSELLKQTKKYLLFTVMIKDARNQLETMIRRWGLEPLILDQLPSRGQTIIEKLEKCTNDVGFGIVLATPDDEGHRRDHPDEKIFRARQNVVLELGMLLKDLGRQKVAICPIPDDHIAPSRSALFLAWSVLKGIRNGGYDANQAA